MKVTNFTVSPTNIVLGAPFSISFSVKREAGDAWGNGLSILLDPAPYGFRTIYHDYNFDINVGATKNCTLTCVISDFRLGVLISIQRTLACSAWGVQFGGDGERVNISFPVILVYPHRPLITQFNLKRAVSGVPNDEGANLIVDIRLEAPSYSQINPPAFTLKLYYSTGDVSTASPYIDLTAQIANGIAGIVNSTSLITQTFSNGATWNFMLAFGDTYELATAYFTLSRSFANMHLSGASTGGVAFGKFSSAQEGEPLFECAYPAEFTSGIDGVNNYVEDEIDTGGKWIDGKPVYRRIITFGAVPARTGRALATLDDYDTFITIRGFMRTSATNRQPLPYVSTNTASLAGVFINSSKAVYIESGAAILDGYLILEYTKTAD